MHNLRLYTINKVLSQLFNVNIIWLLVLFYDIAYELFLRQKCLLRVQSIHVL